MVQRYQQDQLSSPAITQGVSINTNADMFGARQGKTLERVGDILSTTSDRATQMQDDDDELAAANVLNTYRAHQRDYQYNPDSGTMNARGGNAKGLYKKTTEDIQKARLSAVEGLTVRQKELFNAKADTIDNGALDSAARHEVKERKTYAIDTIESSLSNRNSDAVIRRDDDEYQTQTRQGIIDDVMQLGRMNGDSGETMRLNAKKALGDYYLNIANAYASESPARGLEYLQGVQGNMDEVDRMKMMRVLERQAKTLSGQATAAINTIDTQLTSQYGVPLDKMAQVEDTVTRFGTPQDMERLNGLKVASERLQVLPQLGWTDLQETVQGYDVAARADGATETEMTMVKAGKARLKMVESLRAADPMRLYAEAGNQLSDIKTPEGMAERVMQGQQAADQWEITPRYLLSDERKDIKTRIDSGNATELLGMAQTMQQGFGDAFPQVMMELSADNPVFTQAAGMMRYIPNANVTASDMLEGQVLLRENKDIALSKVDYEANFNEAVGGAFELMPEAREALLQSTLALYAKATGGTKADYDKVAFEESLYRAMTGSADDEYGFYTQDDDTIIPLPVGMNKDKAEAVMDNMKHDTLRRLSLGGGLPVDMKGRVITDGQFINNATLKAVKHNTYEVWLNGGRLTDSQTGEAFNMRLKGDE